MFMIQNYSEITPEILALAKLCIDNNNIDPTLFGKYDVKRGLRDINGKGVLTGLTEVSEILSKKIVNGESVPADGQLFYRGYNVEDLVKGCMEDSRFGFEETTYLLLFGQLPTKEQLADFNGLLAKYRSLPPSFVRDVIMKAPSHDMMNSLSRSVLTLYSYDETPDNITPENVLRQSLQLIADFPLLAVYGYHAYRHFHKGDSLFIGTPDPNLSTAENILHILRPDGVYSKLEAQVLDIALILHAEHGGGNNSTFTTRVVTSSGTDTYSAIAAALGSLKGPRHGGANVKVTHMFNDMKEQVGDWNDDDEIRSYLSDLLDKKAFDRSGLIYGMGHAVYSISDPRAKVFRQFVERLSTEKNRTAEFNLYKKVEMLAPEVIGKKRNIYKGVSANIDFYSGFAYQLLDLPLELYTPFFAISRISGWCSHRLEELLTGSKIIRPAYMAVYDHRPYTPLADR